MINEKEKSWVTYLHFLLFWEPLLTLLVKKSVLLFWLVSNGYFITTNFLTGDYPQTILFVFNSLMAVIGYRLWKKKEAVTKKEQEKEVQN